MKTHSDIRTCIPFAILAAAVCHGQVIDFESAPSGGVPTDNAALSVLTPYSVEGVDVTFGFDSDGDGAADVDAVFEKRTGEDPNSGFYSTFGTRDFDSERAGETRSLGNYFLRQPLGIGALPGPLVISYSKDVPALSGEIWDIDASPDGYERWRVSSFDASGTLLEAVESPVGISGESSTSLDSLPWVFVLQHPGIRRVKIEFIGTLSYVGLAFDNFRPTTIPDDRNPQLMIETAILLKFLSEQGRTYTIQDSLDMIEWSDAITDIQGDGTELKFFFEITSPRRFYRLKPPGQ